MLTFLVTHFLQTIHYCQLHLLGRIVVVDHINSCQILLRNMTKTFEKYDSFAVA